MSTKIRLAIWQRPDPDNPLLQITRILCLTAFGSGVTGFTVPEHAIIDTGAPTSLIPKDLWEQCPVLKLGESSIHGIVDRPECSLPIIEGVIGCVLLDEAGHQSPELTIYAHLALTNDVPLLLGFGGLLDQADMRLAIGSREAYLEI